MIYLLDTNTCIHYLNQRSQSVIDRLNRIPENDIVVCSVVKAELFAGALKSQNPQKTLLTLSKFLARFNSLPFDDKAAETYGGIRADLEKAGTPIGGNDLLIASIAVKNNLILVTHNTREFSRVAGLKLEDWESIP
jgi:tRNA(fMet)-specific endonuclease VapC